MNEFDLPSTWPPAYPRHKAVSRAESNEFDRLASAEHGIPSIVLMEHAARGLARIAEQIAGPEAWFLALCGPGNNGGDGYGAARFLRSWGRRVEVCRCAPRAPSAGDAALEYALASRHAPVQDAWERPEALWEALERSPAVVIDALFGVNLDGSRRLEAPFLGWIQALNAAGTVRLAVDVPSGMDAETGAVHPECVQAHVTAVMAAPKLGFSANPEAVGQVVEVDIGLPEAIHGPYTLL